MPGGVELVSAAQLADDIDIIMQVLRVEPKTVNLQSSTRKRTRPVM